METSESQAKVNAPASNLAEGELSRWPKVIGVISLIYAICGLLCQAGGIAWVVFLSEQLAAMGGMDIDIPPTMKLVVAASGIMLFILGIMMIMGAVNLLRRRHLGVQLLKVWAILRVLMVVIGLALHVLMAPTNLQLQRSIEEATNARLREAGQPEQPTKSDDQLWKESIVTAGIMTGLFAIYPVFLGFYLSRRRITNEVEQWR